jgi:hypothetical protein
MSACLWGCLKWGYEHESGEKGKGVLVLKLLFMLVSRYILLKIMVLKILLSMIDEKPV